MEKHIKQIAYSWAICIIIGALAAHSLKAHLSAESLASFETGNRYHFFGNMALMFMVFIAKHYNLQKFTLIYRLQGLGMILFSGSIYILATKSIHGLEFVKYLGPITPIGGLLMIGAWIVLANNIKRKIN